MVITLLLSLMFQWSRVHNECCIGFFIYFFFGVKFGKLRHRSAMAIWRWLHTLALVATKVGRNSLHWKSAYIRQIFVREKATRLPHLQATLRRWQLSSFLVPVDSTWNNGNGHISRLRISRGQSTSYSSSVISWLSDAQLCSQRRFLQSAIEYQP